MNEPLQVGARVCVVDYSAPACGEYGTVTVAEHPAILTGRPAVEVHLDGHPRSDDEVFYVEQLSALRMVST